MNNRDLIFKLIQTVVETPDPREELVTVATMQSIKADGEVRTIDINTALVAPSLLTRIKPSHTNPVVSAKGVHYHNDFAYRPEFWLYLSPSSGLAKAEPLAVSWTANNRTTLLPDQGFLSAFELIPRPINDEILWDDLSKPQYGIVVNKPVSHYSFPNQTGAFVKIYREYLENYIYLRKKTAVQIFTVSQLINLDNDVEQILNGRESFEREVAPYAIRIIRQPHKEGKVFVEVNGYRLLLEQATTTKEVPSQPQGHYWKGIAGIVTSWRARHEMPFEYAYVSDDVLAKYENDDDYEVDPRSGAVRYESQWSVSYCQRVGRNAIKVELKKLYEGTPDEVIDHWNKFSIDPSGIKPEGENIADKAERLARKYLLFGRILAGLLNRVCNLNFTPEDIISLNETRIDASGWMEFPEYRNISKHVRVNAGSKEQFISRSKKLYMLLGENLQEKNLRKAVAILGFPEEDTKEYRSLKLLELILKYLQSADDSGLDPVRHRQNVQQRVSELTSFNRIAALIALNQLRQLDAHKSGDSKSKLHSALQTFGLDSNAMKNNYAKATDHLYDALIHFFSDLNLWLTTINSD